MSQNNTDYTSNPTGNELMDNLLAKSKENGLTCNSGVSRPVYAVKGTLWLDTSVTPHILKLYDGSADISLGTFDITNHTYIPSGLSGKQDVLTFDNAPASGSTNPVTSGGIYTALGTKQATLTFDTTPTNASTNPVTSGGVYTALGTKAGLTENNTFTGTNAFVTEDVSENSTKVATTAYVNNKHIEVSVLPASPNADIWYYIPV